MPSKQEITEECGLSRQTIHSQLSEYAENLLFKAESTQFKFGCNFTTSKDLQNGHSGGY
jgi:hypothetical protein